MCCLPIALGNSGLNGVAHGIFRNSQQRGLSRILTWFPIT